MAGLLYQFTKMIRPLFELPFHPLPLLVLVGCHAYLSQPLESIETLSEPVHMPLLLLSTIFWFTEFSDDNLIPADLSILFCGVQSIGENL